MNTVNISESQNRHKVKILNRGRRKMERGRIVDAFKMSRFAKKALDLMEEEGLNIAEAEEAPKWIESAIKKNDEWQKKGKPFIVFREGN